MPIGMHFSSYRTPFTKISPEGIRVFLFARVLFKVRDEKLKKDVDVLGINFVRKFFFFPSFLFILKLFDH